MPFPEFNPILDEKFKFASFGLTRLNGESIFSLIVSSSSLIFTTSSFVSGSLVPQTTNSQTFDVYSVVSITGSGANPFTLNSNGTYNYQIPTPLPTTNLVLTYLVTRGTKTATSTLTLIFNQFPLCTIEDPNTSDFNLKVYHGGSASVPIVAGTFEGITYPRVPMTYVPNSTAPGVVRTNNVFSFERNSDGLDYKFIRFNRLNDINTYAIQLPQNSILAVTSGGGSTGIQVIWRRAGANTNGTTIFVASGTRWEIEYINSVTVPRVTCDGVLVSALFDGYVNSGIGQPLTFPRLILDLVTVDCFTAAVERPADFKVTASPTLSTAGIPLATQSRENGVPISVTRTPQNSVKTLQVIPLPDTYLRFRFVVTTGSSNYCGWGHNSAQNTFASAITGGTLGTDMKISWYSAFNTASAINYNSQGGSVVGTWEVIFSAVFTTPTVKHNGVVVTGSGNGGRHNTDKHIFSWAAGLQSFEAWKN